ncbi:hypothetical protein PVAND_012964 [Polypedilum vanderplanki]|uniref:Alkaline phosphatase n=1 Tax=Polypedilum vanderplanki TaxID=319348 RepID=A0A9J6CN25_POLVA|nr:hypothetical protein PVAND_012964 [Polypedilum vanderplanki]
MVTFTPLLIFFLAAFTAADKLHPHVDFNDRDSSDEDWFSQGYKYVQENANLKENTKTAKNIIFFLGDGMSIATVTATRAYLGNENMQLAFEKFPYYGLSKTYCVDAQVPDSACTGTAFLCGVKSTFFGLGLTANVTGEQCSFSENDIAYSVLKWAQDAGKATGIVTTARLTDATPAAAYSHVPSRLHEYDIGTCNPTTSTFKDIADQLINFGEGKNIKVALGGGRRSFLPTSVVDEEGTSGFRQDGRNLINEYLADRSRKGTAKYVWNREQLNNIEASKTDYLLGLFEADHMMFQLDVDASGRNALEPYLAEMTKKAIEILKKEKNGFFLLVEGGRIDHGHHANWPKKAMQEAVEFSKAVEVARSLLDDEDTLFVTTSDHSHVFTISGYPVRQNDILKTAGKGDDQLPYETLSYGNGPGYYSTYTATGRRDITNDNFADINRMHASSVPLSFETHAAEDVGVFAIGPWSHLFHGSYEQNTIPLAMAYAAKIGPYK